MKSSLNIDREPAQSFPELLVSVRTSSEIQIGITHKVDICDLKEPRMGPLAPSSEALWMVAASRCGGLKVDHRVPLLSAALGERDDALNLAVRLPRQFEFAKVGPSNCESLQSLLELWSEVRKRLNDRTELVAVAYADAAAAGSLPAETVFRAAKDAGMNRCLIDTYTKDGRSTLDHLGTDGLIRLSQIAEQQGLWWTLAGSIRLEHLARLNLAGIAPNCFGVRGDVCDGGRGGSLSPLRLGRWQQFLAEKRIHSAQSSPVNCVNRSSN